MDTKQTTEQKDILSAAHQDFEKGLNAHAFFKVGNHSTGEDLVQDTFTKTWRYIVRGGKIDTMKAFLYHVLNDLIIDEYRKHKTSSLDVLVEKGFEPSTDDSSRLLDMVDGKAALLLIECLPEKYRQVMRMRYVRMLSLKEIALITGQSKSTVTVQAYRALEKLKRLYSLE